MKTKMNKISLGKGFLQHFKDFQHFKHFNTFLEDFIYNILKSSNKKINTKKTKAVEMAFGTLYL